jgi:hypothetical protein
MSWPIFFKLLKWLLASDGSTTQLAPDLALFRISYFVQILFELIDSSCYVTFVHAYINAKSLLHVIVTKKVFGQILN